MTSAFLNSDILIINITSKNLESFRQFISEIEQSPIKHVLFISSSSVYRNLNREVTEDEGAEDPSSLLFQIEELFRQSQGFVTTVLRLSGLIGPGRHPGRFFRHGKTIPQANAPVNLIHRDDCIGIIQTIIDQQAWQQTFNGCADSHPQKREFYSYARALLQQNAPAFAESPSPSYKIVSNSKIKQQLDYQLHHPDVMKIQTY